MDPSIDRLADDLQAILDGRASDDEFRIHCAVAGWTGPLEIVLCYVEHYLDDSDIRREDPVYRDMQDGEMRKLIAALRSGRLADAAKIHFLGRTP